MGRRGGGTSTSTAVDPYLVVQWTPMLLKGRTVTGGDEPAPEAPAPDAAAKKDAPEEFLGMLRGLALPRELEKPVFVYFHWPHEDGDQGKRIVKFCNGPLDDQLFIRTSALFYCVEINTRDSVQRFVEEAKVRGTPTVMVCRADGTIVWRSEDATLSGPVLAATLRKVVQEKFPSRWTEVEKEMKVQKDALAEARKNLAEKKTEEAFGSLGIAVDSFVRFTEEWTDARKLLADLQKDMEKKAKDEK
jgi:hypothetical protein